MSNARYLFALLLVPFVACAGEDPETGEKPKPDGLPDLVANPRVDDAVAVFLRGCVP